MVVDAIADNHCRSVSRVIASRSATSASFGVRPSVDSRSAIARSTSRARDRTDRGTQSSWRKPS